jgi:hypothetical protein
MPIRSRRDMSQANPINIDAERGRGRLSVRRDNPARSQYSDGRINHGSFRDFDQDRPWESMIRAGPGIRHRHIEVMTQPDGETWVNGETPAETTTTNPS